MWEEVAGGGGNSTSKVQTLTQDREVGEGALRRCTKLCPRTSDRRTCLLVFRVSPSQGGTGGYDFRPWAISLLQSQETAVSKEASRQSVKLVGEPCGSHGPVWWRRAGRNGSHREKGLRGCMGPEREHEKQEVWGRRGGLAGWDGWARRRWG